MPQAQARPAASQTSHGKSNNLRRQVHSKEDLLQVLASRRYQSLLEANPEQRYVIAIDLIGDAKMTPQGTYMPFESITTNPGDELWTELCQAARTHIVEVAPMNFGDVYQPWNGNIYSARTFKAVSIQNQNDA